MRTENTTRCNAGTALAKEIQRQASSTPVRRFMRSLDDFAIYETLPPSLTGLLTRLEEAEQKQL